MANLEALIFDFYETLVELSSGVRDRVFEDVARAVGVQLPSGEARRRWRELAASDSAVRLGGMRRLSLDGEPLPFVSFGETWRLRFTELFEKWGTEASPELGVAAHRDAHVGVTVYPEVPAALDALRGRFRLAVLSDADDDFILPCIERNGLSFEAVVTSEELRAYKPHISVFRETCRRLGVEPEHAAYVGDSPWADIAGARNAGLHAVWVDRHGNDWPEGIEPPPATVTSLDELASLLL